MTRGERGGFGNLQMSYVIDPPPRDQRIPIIWFVANCGGILGLCMGFSIVTVFEVLHYLAKMLVQGRGN